MNNEQLLLMLKTRIELVNLTTTTTTTTTTKIPIKLINIFNYYKY
jgi:hypothetical protein